MDNRYNYFADEEMNEAVRSLWEANDTARATFLQWREKVEKQLVADILETLAKLKVDEGAPEEEIQWRKSAVLRFLVQDFTSGLLYGHRKVQ